MTCVQLPGCRWQQEGLADTHLLHPQTSSGSQAAASGTHHAGRCPAQRRERPAGEQHTESSRGHESVSNLADAWPRGAAAAAAVRMCAQQERRSLWAKVLPVPVYWRVCTRGNIPTHLCICQRQGHAPGAPQHDPLLHTQGPPQLLQVPDQLCCRVSRQAAIGCGAPAAPLVHQDDPVVGWVEEARVVGPAASTGPAMHDNSRDAVGVAVYFIVQGVQLRDLEVAAGMGGKSLRVQPPEGARWWCTLTGCWCGGCCCCYERKPAFAAKVVADEGVAGLAGRVASRLLLPCKARKPRSVVDRC